MVQLETPVESPHTTPDETGFPQGELMDAVDKWEEMKAESAKAKARERSARHKLIEASPNFTEYGDKTGYEELPDGRLLTVSNSYNYKMQQPEIKFWNWHEKLPKEYKGIIKMSHRFMKSEIKKLPPDLREEFDELVVRSQAATQVGFMPDKLRDRKQAQAEAEA